MTENEREQMALNKTLSRVRKLVTLAEHPGTPPAEAKLAREQADALMLKAAITEAMVRDALPIGERQKPAIITVELSDNGEILGYVSWLAQGIATHCRCKIRTFWAGDGYKAKVYGFQADLAYFELLYTTVRLHMLGALAPGIDPDLSAEENAYRLHNAGYNWYDIAQLEGWEEDTRYHQPGDAKYMYLNRKTGERLSWAKAVGPWKAAYGRAIKAKGETPMKVPPGGSENYRTSAANGYVGRIGTRLRLLRAQQDTGKTGGIVLASAAQDLEDFFREDNASMYTRCPRCEKMSGNPYECEFCGQFIKDKPVPCAACAAAKSGHCRSHPAGRYSRGTELNSKAYAAGVAHANAADLGGTKVGATDRRAL